VRSRNCPATVKRAKAHNDSDQLTVKPARTDTDNSHCPDVSGWEGGQVGGSESGNPERPEDKKPFEGRGGSNEI